jgi:aspartate kinase
MSILVQKYGGSSVADVQKIGLVADRVVAAKREGHDVVVVVSAMGKTTDGLIELARKAAASHPATGEPPRRELDMLVSTGERVTMALLSIAIHARGCDAISFTGSQSGILTNDRHFDARIIEVRPHRIQDELARGRIVIVAGYQGMSYKREITTLGRGGSDTTAVALAAALGACRCEIYSDVDGVYSADPRVVPDAKHLPELDLAVLAEMAEAGAKVLNAQAVSWARRNKVAIVARRTSDTDGTGRETIAVASENDENRNVRAVVGGENIMLLRVRTSDLGAFLAVAEGEALALGDVVASEDSALVHLPLLSVPDWEREKRALKRALSDRVTFVGKRATASVIGYGLTGAGSALSQTLRVLSRHDVKPQCLYAGPLRISVTVSESELSGVQRALHAELVVTQVV